jgi:hypothetical protein
VKKDAFEQTAQRIADQGREALLGRLRPAFKEAAAAHADVIKLDDEQIEQMVQRAAGRADGLQWRRALAAVAVQELDIRLADALHHPAVVRAQELVGAPSYEEAIAEMRAVVAEREAQRGAAGEAAGAETHTAGETEAVAGEPVEPREAEVPGEAEAPGEAETPGETGEEAEDETEWPPAGTGEAAEPEAAVAKAGEAAAGAPAEEAPRRDPRVVTLRAVHVEGLKNLDAADDDLRLRFSGRGLELLRQSDGAVLMRLRWREIHALELPTPRGRLRRRHRHEARLVVLSDMGSATFEIPGATSDQLRTRLAPVHRVR